MTDLVLVYKCDQDAFLKVDVPEFSRSHIGRARNQASLNDVRVITIITRRPKLIKLQNYFRMKICKRKYQQKKKWAIYRKHVILELTQTEETYVNDLEIVVKKIMQPARRKKLLDEEDIKKLFLNIEFIYQLNKKFSEELTSIS